jgi:hypothetical protein
VSRPPLACALLALALIACTDGAQAPPSATPSAPPPHTPPSASQARREVRAPIVGVATRTAESYPPQYFADVTSALPNGCAQFSRAELHREGDTLVIDVFNTEPVGESIACTMIYGEKETTVALGSEFTPGESYALDVNGTLETFVAQ